MLPLSPCLSDHHHRDASPVSKTAGKRVLQHLVSHPDWGCMEHRRAFLAELCPNCIFMSKTSYCCFKSLSFGVVFHAVFGIWNRSLKYLEHCNSSLSPQSPLSTSSQLVHKSLSILLPPSSLGPNYFTLDCTISILTGIWTSVLSSSILPNDLYCAFWSCHYFVPNSLMALYCLEPFFTFCNWEIKLKIWP